jgi:hypothetical protein
MKRREDAEAEVLDRLMHLLEEGSVSHLIQEDHGFGVFIGGLYETLQNKAEHLNR